MLHLFPTNLIPRAFLLSLAEKPWEQGVILIPTSVPIYDKITLIYEKKKIFSLDLFPLALETDVKGKSNNK